MHRRIRILLSLVVGLLATIVPAHGASFDCAKASTKVEHLICGNPEISKLDSKLLQDYQDVLSKANEDQKQRVISEQKHWLKFTRNVCEKQTCIKHAYWSRQAALENYFEPRSPVYKKESDKAGAIKQVLATTPLHPLFDIPFCRQIFDDLKQMKGIRFVDPIVQVQSYEDPALDSWKEQCQSAPPFNFSYQCERNIEATDADDVVDACKIGYGLPPFKLYELPPDATSSEKRYIFYADEAYGPMNRDFRQPRLGGGFSGFEQINIAKCLSMVGNRWEDAGKRPSTWRGAFADAGQGGRNGKNFNSIFEYKNHYYFLVLHEKYDSYRLDISSVMPNGTSEKMVCNWFPR